MNDDSVEIMKEENIDEMARMLGELEENADIFKSLLDILKRLKKAGVVGFLDNLSKDFMPTDVEFLGKFFTSREFSTATIKAGNTMIAMLYTLLSEQNSDLVKLLLYNAEGFSEAIIDGAKNPRKMSLLSLYSMIKDPDVASGMTALLNALKVLGKVINEKM